MSVRPKEKTYEDMIPVCFVFVLQMCNIAHFTLSRARVAPLVE